MASMHEGTPTNFGICYICLLSQDTPHLLLHFEYMNTIPAMQTHSRDRSTTSFRLTGIKWSRMMRSCQAYM